MPGAAPSRLGRHDRGSGGGGGRGGRGCGLAGGHVLRRLPRELVSRFVKAFGAGADLDGRRGANALGRVAGNETCRLDIGWWLEKRRGVRTARRYTQR